MTPTNENSDMKLEITGRHVKITPALRTYAREKLEKIRRLVEGSLEIHVILTVEKHRHAAEILVHGRHLGLSAREVTADMYTSIGECVEKLETQARKQKEKFTTRRRRAGALSENPPEVSPGPENPKSSRAPSAARRRKSSDGADSDGPQIVRTSMPRRKPMSVEEAAVQVMETDLGFIVFRNDRSQSINILYRRKDGRLGLIEPEG